MLVPLGDVLTGVLTLMGQCAGIVFCFFNAIQMHLVAMVKVVQEGPTTTQAVGMCSHTVSVDIEQCRR